MKYILEYIDAEKQYRGVNEEMTLNGTLEEVIYEFEMFYHGYFDIDDVRLLLANGVYFHRDNLIIFILREVCEEKRLMNNGSIKRGKRPEDNFTIVSNDDIKQLTEREAFRQMHECLNILSEYEIMKGWEDDITSPVVLKCMDEINKEYERLLKIVKDNQS